VAKYGLGRNGALMDTGEIVSLVAGWIVTGGLAGWSAYNKFKAKQSENRAKQSETSAENSAINTVETVEALKAQIAESDRRALEAKAQADANQREIEALKTINEHQDRSFRQLSQLHDQLEQDHERIAVELAKMQAREQDHQRRIQELTIKLNDATKRYDEAMLQNKFLTERLSMAFAKLEAANLLRDEERNADYGA
jgi:predicted RNase H-like nuclease (RuvC/YqgF family)